MGLETFTLHELIDSTGTGGHCRFLCNGQSVKRLCLVCDAEFEQTDEGFKALRAHEFEHGIASLFSWSEIDGKTLRMVVVQSSDKTFGHWSNPNTDIYGVDDASGVVYHLTHIFRYQQDDIDKGSWKWKITNQATPSDGPKPTRFALASPSSGSESTGEK